MIESSLRLLLRRKAMICSFLTTAALVWAALAPAAHITRIILGAFLLSVANLGAIAGESRKINKIYSDAKRITSERKLAMNLVDQLAHEIHTPALELRLLASDLENSKGASSSLDERCWSRLTSLVERITALIDSFTLFNPYAIDQFRSTRATQNLNTICDTAIMSAKLLGARTRFQRRYAAGVTVDGNSSELAQMVRNLLKNAIEATSATGLPIVEVVTELRRSSGSSSEQVVLKIMDNGPGFDLMVLDRPCEEGFTTKPGLGRGYGMFIAKNIAMAHGGTMSLWNREKSGSGAIVEIALPYSPLRVLVKSLP